MNAILFAPKGTVMAIDEAKLNTFMGSFVHDLGAVGAQAGEARIREVVGKGGFQRFRRATETPFNLIYEARP